jgi:hypothetical protein
VKAEEPSIAVFAPERVQKDKSQQWLEGDPVRTPYRIIASTFWAIWHHGSSNPRAVRYARAPSIVRAYAHEMNEKVNSSPPINLNSYFRSIENTIQKTYCADGASKRQYDRLKMKSS